MWLALNLNAKSQPPLENNRSLQARAWSFLQENAISPLKASPATLQWALPAQESASTSNPHPVFAKLSARAPILRLARPSRVKEGEVAPALAPECRQRDSCPALFPTPCRSPLPILQDFQAQISKTTREPIASPLRHRRTRLSGRQTVLTKLNPLGDI